MRILVGVFLTLIFIAQAQARTAFVSDMLYVPLRSSPDKAAPMNGVQIKSGDAITIKQESVDKDWVNIENLQKQQGWMPKRYITLEPVAATQLTQAREELSISLDKNTRLEADVKQLKAGLCPASSAPEPLQPTVDQEQCAVIDQRNKELLTKMQMIQTEYDTIRAENDRLRSKDTINQWLVGAGLVFCGMILMLILPAFIRPRRHAGWVD